MPEIMYLDGFGVGVCPRTPSGAVPVEVLHMSPFPASSIEKPGYVARIGFVVVLGLPSQRHRSVVADEGDTAMVP
jgi:hypothetical protein